MVKICVHLPVRLFNVLQLYRIRLMQYARLPKQQLGFMLSLSLLVQYIGLCLVYSEISDFNQLCVFVYFMYFFNFALFLSPLFHFIC